METHTHTIVSDFVRWFFCSTNLDFFLLDDSLTVQTLKNSQFLPADRYTLSASTHQEEILCRNKKKKKKKKKRNTMRPNSPNVDSQKLGDQ